jgi:1,4-dihydroxy-2-naphthoate octaprenyltransferase
MRARSLLIVGAAAFVALAVLEVVFVAGDDTYRADGTSNWAAYERMRPAAVAAIALCCVSSAAAAFCAVKGRPGWIVVPPGVLALGCMFVSWAATLN